MAEEMRAVAVILMTEYPPESLQWAIGYQMNLCGLSLQNALDDPAWEGTLVLHARALAHNARLFLGQ